jgi:hypothetical protein
MQVVNRGRIPTVGLVAESLGVPEGEAALPVGGEGCAPTLGRLDASAGGGDLLGYDVIDVHRAPRMV